MLIYLFHTALDVLPYASFVVIGTNFGTSLCISRVSFACHTNPAYVCCLTVGPGCLPLENLKDKQLKMNIKLLIIKHKKGKEKGREKGPTDQKRSLMDSGATLYVPQGNPKCEARV
jgi:hypothetical protein